MRGLDLDGLAQDEEPRCASGEARGGRRLRQVTSLILKRASGSRPGQWRDNDYDVPAEGEVVGRNHAVTRRARGPVMDVDAGLRAPSRIAFRATATSRRARRRWRRSPSPPCPWRGRWRHGELSGLSEDLARRAPWCKFFEVRDA